MSSMRVLRWAIVVSVCIHLALLLAGRGYWSAWLADDESEKTLDVRLLSPVKPVPRIAPKAPKPIEKTTEQSTEQSRSPVSQAANTQVAQVRDTPDIAANGGIDVAAEASATPIRILPGNGRIRFDVTKGESEFIVGRAVHDWKIDGDRYELRSVIETTGIVALFADVRLGQTSVGHIDAGGLHPDTFQDNRKDGQYRSEFDWAHGKLMLSNGNIVPLEIGAQDILSMFYQLALYPLDEPDLAMMVTTGRKCERYVFKVERDVELWLNRATDDASIRAYHLSYRGREAEGVDVWLARDMDRLPVKIRYTDRNGGVTEMVAREINYSGKR